MARSSSLHTLFLKPTRPSLRRAGIPDGRDILALYLWWLRDQSERDSGANPPDSAAASISSVLSVLDTAEWHEREEPPPPSPTVRIGESDFGLETGGVTQDLLLLGIGGQFGC